MSNELTNKNFIILASQRDNFAISDLDVVLFRRRVSRKTFRDTSTQIVRSIAQTTKSSSKEFFARSTTEPYRVIENETVTVTINDAKDARVFQQEVAPLKVRHIQR